MNDTISYQIREVTNANIDIYGKFYVTYKRSFMSPWKSYMLNGSTRTFNTHEDATRWLQRKGVGYIQLRLVN